MFKKHLKRKIERVPLPPKNLLPRIGSDGVSTFVEEGKYLKECVKRSIPITFSLKDDTKILDFGCGVGRLMVHLLEESKVLDIWGCDIDSQSIGWIKENLGSNFKVFQNKELPPLNIKNDFFDIVIALSVFTHLPAHWMEWLREVNRILRPGGVALLSFQSRSFYLKHVGPVENLYQKGMEVVGLNHDWDVGGPQVYHSNKWIIENWSQIMPVIGIIVEGLGGGQSLAILEKKGAPKQNRVFVTQPFTFQPKRPDIRGYVEYDPYSSNNWWHNAGWSDSLNMPLHGWFLSDHAPIETIKAKVKNGPKFELSQIKRPDVASKYSNIKWAIDSGFLFNASSLELLKVGNHIVIIEAKDKLNNLHCMEFQINISKTI